MPFSNNFPYTDLHDINLNKFLKAIKNLLGGHGGEFLRKKSNIPFDYEWSNVGSPSGSVTSVNGQTGDVVLDAQDVGALPDSYTAPVRSVNGQMGTVVLDYQDVGALPDSYTPPPAPVQSVNGQTGTVVLDYQDVGALPDSYTPPPAPVQSVNRQTGTVVLDAQDVGGISMKLLWTNASPRSPFAAQTVSLDLSAFDKILIKLRFGTSSGSAENAYFFEFCDIGETTALYAFNVPNTASSSIAPKMVARNANVSNSGVVFGGGLIKNLTTEGSPTNDNTACVPYQIYGIKGIINT